MNLLCFSGSAGSRLAYSLVSCNRGTGPVLQRSARFGAVANSKLTTESNLKEENLMKFYKSLLAIATLAVVAAIGLDRMVDAADAPPLSMGFFVTSAKSKTGNLNRLAGADRICQDLATAAGQGDKTWRAYLRVEQRKPDFVRPTCISRSEW